MFLKVFVVFVFKAFLGQDSWFFSLHFTCKASSLKTILFLLFFKELLKLGFSFLGSLIFTNTA